MLHAMVAEEPPREERREEKSFTDAGTVVLDDVVGGHATAFGPVGLGAATGFSVGWASFASTNAGEMTAKTITVMPSADVFVADGFSLGATIGLSASRFESNGLSQSATAATVMPRIGEAFSISRDVILWPRFGAGVTFADGPGNMGATIARANFDVPFVFVIAHHVAFDVGPELTYTMQLDHGSAQTFAGGVYGGLSLVF